MICTCTYNGYCEYHGRIKYVPPYWDDLRIPATSARIGPVNPPTFSQLLNNGAGSTGVYTWHFSPTITEDLFFAAQMPHAYLQESPIYPHVHWCCTTSNAGNVVWELEFTRAEVNSFFSSSSIYQIIATGSGFANYHQVNSFPTINMIGKTISSMILCRLSRVGGNVNDTYPDDAALLEIDFHFQLDTPGSRQETVK
jgi:hypothetical protein